VRAASILHNNAANVLFNMNCPEAGAYTRPLFS